MRLIGIYPAGWTAYAVVDDTNLFFRENVHIGSIKDSNYEEIDKLCAKILSFNADRILINWVDLSDSARNPIALYMRDRLPGAEFADPEWRARTVSVQSGRVFAGWTSCQFRVEFELERMLADSIAGGSTLAEKPAKPLPWEISIEAPAPLPWEAPVRICGIDAGSAHLGISILDVSASGAKYVAAMTLPVGEKVPLKKPRGEVTTRHSVTAKHLDAIREQVVSILQKNDVKHVAIEHVESVHFGAGDAMAGGGASSMATALIRTSLVDETIRMGCMHAEIDVRHVSAASWRAKVVGRKKRGGAGAELIPQAIEAKIAGWPRTSDPHERDAAGVALWLAQELFPPPEPPRRPGRQKRALEARAKAKERKCECWARHRVGCQFYVPRVPKACGCIGRHRVECALFARSEPKPCGCPGKHRRTCELF